jgi:hypothetical protein
MTGIEHMGGSYLEQFGPMTPDQRRAAFAELARAGVVLDPNVGGEAVRALSDSAVATVVADTLARAYPEMKGIPPHLLELFRRDLGIRELEHRMAPVRDWPASYRKEVALLQEAHRAGVRIVAGTDVPSLLMVPGASLQDELRLLVRDVGMTPLEALRAATLEPARALHLEASHGTVAVGKAAELLLLDADPLADIANLARISLVIAGGRAITPTR